MQNGRHLLRKVHMTPSVYFTHAEKTMPSDQSVLIILKENQAQSKVKNNYSLYRYKRLRQTGSFLFGISILLQQCLYSDTSTKQIHSNTDFPSNQFHPGYPGHPINNEIRENVNQDHSAEILGSELNLNHNFRRHRSWVSKDGRSFLHMSCCEPLIL